MTGLPAQEAASGLVVSLMPCPVPDLLAREWRTLEAQARPSFFTSWTWISTWLNHLRPSPPVPRPALLRVHRGTELVGLGLVVERAGRRLRWWPSQGLHLHATGQAAWDDITIEHNGWLARADLAPQVHQAVAAQVWALVPGVDHFRLPALSTAHSSGLAWKDCVLEAQSGGAGQTVCEVREDHTEEAYRVDLDAVRASGQAYLDRLGSPTRAAIRRSLRLYESLGPLRLELAATVDEGLHFLSRLKHFHQATWQARGRPGAFANPRFERFHHHLVRSALPAGEVQLLRLRAGTLEVGYLYNFAHAGQVLAYQSGFHFGLTERNHHPGLVTHAMAVQKALDGGSAGYDFLAGQARYKEQLANQRYVMSTVTLHRPSVGWRLERAWRRWQAWQRAARARLAPAGRSRR